MTITEAAAQHLAVVLDNARANDRTTVRLAPGERGWVIQLDQPDAGDRSYDHGGRTVLVVAADADEVLSTALLDVCETEGGDTMLVLKEAKRES